MVVTAKKSSKRQLPGSCAQFHGAQQHESAVICRVPEYLSEDKSVNYLTTSRKYTICSVFPTDEWRVDKVWVVYFPRLGVMKKRCKVSTKTK